MLIFIYMALLLAAGLALRASQIVSGEYFAQSSGYIAEDAISMAFVYFGMLGVWGYARRKAVFSRSLWKVYFAVAAALIPVTPFISPKYQQLLVEHGPGVMMGAYVASALLIFPALWAWYVYAFRQPGTWTRSARSPAAA